MDGLTLFIIIIITIVALLYGWYVHIVSKRNKVLEALSGIDVQLKQRLDLIPNILKIASRFLKHESELLTEITALRSQLEKGYSKTSQQEVQDHLSLIQQISDKAGKFMVTVEHYPELKSDATMLQAMQSYNEIETRIAAARRFYNSAVTSLNNAVQIFPGTFIAKMADIEAMPFYEADEQVHMPLNADNYLR